MKSKRDLVLSIVFLIAIIYDTVQIFHYGMANISVRFFVSYTIQIMFFFSLCFSYIYYKNK